jgi:transposase-like protein
MVGFSLLKFLALIMVIVPNKKERNEISTINHVKGITSIYGSSFNSYKKTELPKKKQYNVRWLNHFLKRNLPSKIPRVDITEIKMRTI